MNLDVDKIIVKDRIRKDFGDIEELAEDIRENGLINPPVINRDNVLLAGERRLRACKLLGWPYIEVRQMDTRDAEHELNVEISENDVRKGFTKAERVDYMRRLFRIEQTKAKERMADGGKGVEIDAPLQRADEATAEQFGISASTMRREMFIADNADLLEPADFADWDEGRLSTNKAYQRIKAAKEQAERDKAMAEREKDAARADLEDAYKEIAALEKQNDQLYERATAAAEPQVTYPEDYERTKQRMRSLKADNERLSREYQDMWHKKLDLDKKLDEAKALLGEKERQEGARWDIRTITTAINSFLRQYGGNVWAFDQFDRVDEPTQEEFKKAIANMAAFSQNIVTLISERKLNG